MVVRFPLPSIPSRPLLVVAVLLGLVPVSPVAGQTLRPRAAMEVRQMELAAGDHVEAVASRRGMLRFVSTRPGAPIPVVRAGTATERARAFLGEYGSAFGLGPGVEMSVRRVSPPDEVGMEHVRLAQTYRGVPVTGGEMTVHLRGQGVVAVNAKLVDRLDRVDTVPRVTAAEALELARAELARTVDLSGAELSEPRLEILDKGHLGGRGLTPVLAWFVEARRVDLREDLWIDAVAGKPVLELNQLTDVLFRGIFDANDPGDGVYGDLPGDFLRMENGAAVVGAAAADANAAYDFSGDTYDYFWTEHGRDSYDDAGTALVSSVRYCPKASSCPYFNAFWNGDQMVYGEGFALADDVAAHELTHAVTEHSAGLFYYMQSGALNESYSDIFGETVDLTNGAGTDTDEMRWLFGEDVPRLGAGRDMMNPEAFGDPGRMSSPDFDCSDSWISDRGGVHQNSGVPNHAYALMVDGGNFNGQVVTGIGLTKAGKIEYRALTRYLLSASDFLDDYHALIQSCRDLVGVAGITATDCAQVTKALAAVEMSQPWPCAPTQAAVPAYCPPGRGPVVWYYQDFENGLGTLPDCPADDVSTTWCVNGSDSLLGAFATSGTKSLWGYPKPSVDVIWVGTTLGSMPPPKAHMQFNHSYGFENRGLSYQDGGKIYLTTDGANTWFDAGPLITVGQNYGGTISEYGDNPWAGDAAFGGDTFGYTATQLNLNLLTGTDFGYFFRIATDGAIDDYGWWVDDVRIYTCPTCVTYRLLGGAYTGMASHYKASSFISAGNGFTVLPDESVTFEVGGKVVLTDGFKASGSFTVITDSSACP